MESSLVCCGEKSVHPKCQQLHFDRTVLHTFLDQYSHMHFLLLQRQRQSVHPKCQKLLLDRTVLRICCTFYATMRTVVIMASMPHAPILSVVCKVYCKLLQLGHFDCHHLSDIAQRLAGTCIFLTKISFHTILAKLHVFTFAPIAFFPFCFGVG